MRTTSLIPHPASLSSTSAEASQRLRWAATLAGWLLRASLVFALFFIHYYSTILFVFCCVLPYYISNVDCICKIIKLKKQRHSQLEQGYHLEDGQGTSQRVWGVNGVVSRCCRRRSGGKQRFRVSLWFFHPVSSFHGTLAAASVGVGGRLAPTGATPSNIRENIPLTSDSLVVGCWGAELPSGGSDVRHVVQVCDSAAFIHQHGGVGLCPKWQDKTFCVLHASSGAQHR